MKDDMGTLLLTEASRACARMWRSLHGRRFAAYKSRKDEGKKRKRRAGTLASVRVGQQKAMQRLLDRAKRAGPGGEADNPMTLLGVRRRELKRTADSMEAEAPSKATLDFRKTTADRMQEKRERAPRMMRVWPGYGRTKVERRRRTGPVTDDGMVAKPTAHGLAPPAGRWIQRPAASQGAAAGSRDTQGSAADQTGATCEPSCLPQSAMTVTVDSLRDLDAAAPKISTEKVKMWIEAIAYGQRVKETSATGRSLQLAPAIASPAAVFMSDKFKRIHTAAYVAFLKATKAKDSKWKLVTKADKSARRVYKLQDLWAVARSARELPHIAGVLPSYQKPPRNVKLPQEGYVGRWRLRPGTSPIVTSCR